MKYISLIEVTAAELDGDPPAAGGEIVHRDVPYRILQVKTTNIRRSRWMRGQLNTTHQRYQLLVEALQNPAER